MQNNNIKKSLLFRFVTFYSVLSILLQSLLPFFYVFPSVASAQDITPTETISPTNEPSVTPTTEPTAMPTNEPTVSPTMEPTPTDTITPTITPIPTDGAQITPEVTPTATPSPTQGDILEGIATESAKLLESKIPLRKAGNLLKEIKKQAKKNYVEGEVIIKFKKNKLDVRSLFGKAQAFVFEKKFALEKRDEIKASNIQVFKSKKSTDEMVRELKTDSNVEYAQPNYIYEPTAIGTDDTYKDLLWGLDNTGQTVDGTVGSTDIDIDAPEAWAVSEGSNSVIVAVIDTGVAYNHPDLIANMWDGLGCKDDTGAPLGGCNHGYDYENNDKTPLPDSSSHGTHIAGTIAAVKNNAKGIIGVAPKAIIMAIKTSFTTSENVKSINFAQQNGAKVINASWVGTYNDTTLKNAINGFNGLFVTSAGNCGDVSTFSNNGCSSQNQTLYPASFDLANIISVAATDQNNNLATFSNYGITSVDVGAPGTNIYSSIADLSSSYLNGSSGETFETTNPGSTPSNWLFGQNWGIFDFGASGHVLYGDVNYYPYQSNANTVSIGPTYNLSGASEAAVDFWASCDTQYTTSSWADYMMLEISADGTNYTEVLRWDEAYLDSDTNENNNINGKTTDFLTAKIKNSYLTPNFKFRFRWVTDTVGNGTTGDGCLLDDVRITKYTLGSTERYDYMDGTSMAAPHVAGLAALIEGYNSNLTSTQVKDIILSTGDNVSALSGKTVTGKRINAYNALVAAAPLSSTKAITSFTIPSQVGATVINETAHTIGMTMNFGTNVTALVPAITHTGSSISPESGVVGNFSSPKKYTVTAADSSIQEYTVTVSFTEDPVAAAFDIISANLAASPNNVANNLKDVTSANVSSFAGLSFEKSISGVPVGKLAFSSALNLSSTETRTFLENLGTKLEQGNGRIALDARESAVFSATGATLTMYGFTTDIPQSQLIVRDDTDTVLNQTGLITNFTQDPTTHNITFSTAHFTQFDIDITKPEIAFHANVGPFEATSSTGAVATYESPSVTDNIDAPSTASCSPLSGATFPLGQTTITCNKTDTAGNTAIPTTFTVTVVDSTKPVIAAHTSITTLATSPSGASVTYTAPLATDNVDTTSEASCTPASGSTFPIGVTTVTCTKTDAAGNSATPKTFTVTVNKNPPVLDSIGNKTVNELTNLTFTAHATDVDSTPTYSLTNAPIGATIDSSTGAFNFTPTEAQGPGTYTVTVSASDDSSTDSEIITITVNEVNVAPVASTITTSTNEDTTKIITLTSTDSDYPANTLSFIKVTDPTHGTVSITGSQATYSPTANYNGSDSFTYKSNDGSTDSDPATVSITVSAVNDPPSITSVAPTPAIEDTLYTYDASVSDIDGPSVTWSKSLSDTCGGSITSDTGIYTFTPAGPTPPASCVIGININDNGTPDLSAIQTTTISITAVNDLPVSGADSYTTNEDATLTVTAPGVLTNDNDPDGANITAVLISNVLHGTLTLNSNGSFSYAPVANYNGPDSFTYKATDGQSDSNTTTVTITVSPANDNPVAVANSYTTEEGTAMNIANSLLLANDTDVDGDTLTIQSVSNAIHGTVELDNFDPNDKKVIFTPDTNFFGTAGFDYTITDGTLTSTATVSITYTPVNDAPILAAIGNQSINEFATLTTTVSASDVDNANLTYTTNTLPANATFDSSTRTLTFTPVESQGGNIYSVTFTVTDGTLTDSETIAISVNEVPNAPVAVNDSTSVDEDVELTIDTTTLLSNDYDLDTDTNAGLTITAANNAVNGTVSLTGSTITFSPIANFYGSASFEYVASDGSLTDIGTVVVTVNAVNDPPSFDAIIDQTIYEDSLLQTVGITNISEGTGESGQTVSMSATSSDTSVIPSPSVSGTGATRSLTYTPTTNKYGSAIITVTANDGQLLNNLYSRTFTITVSSVNDAPVAYDDTSVVSEDSLLTIPKLELLSNDTDIEGDSLYITSVLNPINGSVAIDGADIVFTPTANFSGNASIEYTVSDGNLTDIGLVTITVNPINDAPVLDTIGNKNVDEFSTLSTIAYATDIDNGTLTYTISGLPANATFNATTKTFTFTPNESQGGSTYNVTFTVSDGTLTDSETIAITVNEVNNAPVAANDTATIDEDSHLTINTSALLANDKDLDTDTNVGLSINEVNTPVNGEVSISGSIITFTPNTNFNGIASFNYVVTDGSLTDTGSVSITVNAVNDKPVANVGSITTTEDTSVEITLSGTDVDGDSLTYAIVSTVSHGTLGDVAGNKVTYTPTLNYNGPASFTFKANDGKVDSDAATVSITVTAVNDAPVLDTIGNKSVNELANLTFTAHATDVDSTPAYSFTNAPTGATINSSTGVFSFTPTEEQGPGTYTVTISATDGISTDSEIITITVVEVNTKPVANDISTSTNEDTNKEIALTASDSDLPQNNLTYSKVAGPAHGSVTVTGNKATYTPIANYNGLDSFTYKANDGIADSEAATVTITVTAINDSPVAVNDSYTTGEDTVYTIEYSSLLSNDTDIDTNHNNLTVSAVSGPVYGTVVNSPSENKVIFTPNANYFGTASFDYTITDGSLTSTATVTILYSSVNDTPIANDGSISTLEDTAIEITLLGNDIEGDSLTYSIVSGVSHGTLGVVSGNKVTYISSTNYNGSDLFTFKTNDGLLDSDAATVSITVTPVNDAPVLNSIGNKSVNELTDLTFTATAIDPDNSVIYSLTNAPTGATIDGTTGVFSFTPTEAQGPGTFAVTISVTDGTSTDSEEITITVNEANVLPVAQAIDASTAEDTIKIITLSGTDSDIPVNTLTYSKATNPAHGTVSITGDKATYTPAVDYNGTDSFTYKANDGIADSVAATVTITITPVNDTPVAVANSYTTNEDTVMTLENSLLLTNDTDVDRDILSIQSVSNAIHGKVELDNLDPNGKKVIFTPTLNFNGIASFDYTITDGALSSIATVTITYNPVNDAPVANNDSSTTNEDTLAIINLSGTDIEGNSLIYSKVTNPSHGTLGAISGTQVTYTPSSNYNGSDSFTFKANDGKLDSNTATITINVIAVNDAPFAVDDSASTNEDTSVTITASALLSNDTDVDNIPAVSAVGNAVNGIVSLNGTNITFTPKTNFYGSASFEYTSSDGSLIDTGLVTVTVIAINDAPEAVNNASTTAKNTLKILSASSVLSNDSDIENDDLSITSVGSPVHGTVSFDGTNISFTPELDFIGDASFEYTISDGNSGVDTGIVTIIVLSDTQTAPDNKGEATLDSETPEVVVTDPDDEVTVTVDGTTEATIDVGSFITDGEGNIPKITINSDSAEIAIPATAVTGSTGWDGVIAAPTVTSVTLPNISGETLTTSAAIELGFADGKLSFDKAVRILLPGQVGKRAGYSRPGLDFTEITSICDADNQAAGDALGVDGECKIDVGLDLVIWTKHFTKFAAYTQTTNSTSSSSTSSSSGGVSNSTAPVCNDQKPGSAPVLLSAVAGFNSVTLTWSKSSDPVSYYLVTYGTSSGSQAYGNPNVGGSSTTSYTITNLSGGATYFFKVRAGNGCAPGEFSNEASAAPSGGFIAGVAPGFSEGVLGEKTSVNEDKSKETVKENANKNNVLGEGTAVEKKFSYNYIIALIILIVIVGSIIYIKRKK